jgi:hypothetical protein
MIMIELAPVALFVYDRPEHTKKTIEALQKNKWAKESELFIFSDAPRDEASKDGVDEVRKYIKDIQGFKKVTTVKRLKNWGLAASIIDGVTEVVNAYGKIIVLEDDLITSPYFLKYMNEGLVYYQNEKKVWHISGWNYPIDQDGLGHVFLWRLMNCWGWATWNNRWIHYEKNIEKTIRQFSKSDIKRLNLDGTEAFYNQVKANKSNEINTWAIFWYTTIFKKDGLCVNPTQSFVENIGHDGSGVHCIDSPAFKTGLSIEKHIKFSSRVEEDKIALNRIQEFYKKQRKSLFIRAINKLSRIAVVKNLIN